MSNDMKCPFCGEKLVKWIGYADCRFWTCYNVLCEAGRFGHIADECIWQELIRTRKALEIIKKEMSNEYMPDFAVIRDALKIALEQKEG